MASPPPTLLSFSPDRTLWLQGDEVRKVYERGSIHDAEAELAAARLLAGPGFVAYRRAEPDPATGRPSVVLDHVRGRDLEALVAAEGPLDPVAAVACVAAVGRTLLRCHARAVHGDVKPANILVPGEIDPRGMAPILVDAEHAVARGRQEGFPAGGPAGGSHGYMPPEAYRGVPADPSFDTFGLGATLHYLLAGSAAFGRRGEPGRTAAAVRAHAWRRRTLRGQPPELVAAIAGCVASAGNRITLDELVERLDAFLAAARSPTGPRQLDRVLALAQQGEIGAARAALDEVAVDAEPERRAELEHLLRRGAPPPLPPAPAANEDLAERARLAVAASTAVGRVLHRFPAHRGSLQRAQELRRELAALLQDLPEVVAAHKRSATHAAAEATLTAVAKAMRAIFAFGPPIWELASDETPTPLQRDPDRLLQLTRNDLQGARARHDDLMERLRRAEAALDPAAATEVIEALSGVYSGASDVVAAFKDRWHRLTFHLERLTVSKEHVDHLSTEIRAQLTDIDFGPVEQLLQHCREETTARGNPRRTATPGLRVLQRTIRDLRGEFPDTGPAVAAAAQTLAEATGRLSDRAWQIVGECRDKLRSVPIPIRPLQNHLARLDRLRLLDALVDRPTHTRADLLDEVEHLRVEIEHARTARDRLTSGAREAMERGHLTTALYEMARAVDRYADAPADELEKARRRKREIEEALRDNHRLATRYAELEESAGSGAAERLQVLEARRRALLLLVSGMAAERAATYRRDLYGVEEVILREHLNDAEARLAAACTAETRAEIARAALTALRSAADGGGHTPPAELLARFQALAGAAGEAETAATAPPAPPPAAAETSGRRSIAGWILAAVLAVALGFVWLHSGGRADRPWQAAAAALGPQLQGELQAADFAPVLAALQLERFAGDLERADVQRAEPGGAELVAAVRGLVDVVSGAPAELQASPDRWRQAVLAASARLRAAAAAPRAAGGACGAVAAAVARFDDRAGKIAALIAERAAADPAAQAAAAAWVRDAFDR